MTAKYAYPFSSIRGDYIRSIGGVVLCLSPFALGLPLTGALYLVAFAALVFALLLARTILRHVTAVTVSDGEITLKSLQEQAVPWEGLAEFDLSYFTTWRSGSNGWMQLRLRGAGKTLRLESSVDGFEEITRSCFDAARRNKLELNRTTLSNLAALGIVSEEEAMAPE